MMSGSNSSSSSGEDDNSPSAVPPVVKQISEWFIKPKPELEESQRKPVYLAAWDLAMLSVLYIQKGLLFHKPASSDTINSSLLCELKDALSTALFHFYPLAGRFETELSDEQQVGEARPITSSSSLVFIDPCKGPGARFIHASLDLTISDLLSPKDVPLVVQSLFDHDRVVNHEGHTRSLLSVQVTELVDGIFIGLSMNHAVGDGTSYWHFWNSWSEIFMAKLNKSPNNILISRPPIHTRLLFSEQASGGGVIRLPFGHPDEFISRFEAPKLRERIFHFSSESIRRNKARANSDIHHHANNHNHIIVSSFQALSALMWRCITRARLLSEQVDQTTCKLAINNRSRLNPPLSDSYFGNCIQTVQYSCQAQELLKQSLGWTALKLNQAVNAHDDKAVRSMVEDWMRAPQVYQIETFFNSLKIVMMGSSPRFNMYQGNQFGLGKAICVLSGYAHKFDGKVTAYPGREGPDSVDLEICLLPDNMTALESDQEFMSLVSSS